MERDRNNSRRVHPIHCWMEKWMNLHSCRHHTITNLYSRCACHSRLRLYRIYCSVSNNHHHQRIEHLRKKLHNEEMRFEIIQFLDTSLLTLHSLLFVRTTYKYHVPLESNFQEKSESHQSQ